MPISDVFVMAIPIAPFRCPTAPYGRVSLVAQFLKRHKPRFKVILLDGNQDIIAKKVLFTTAWKKYYGYGTENSLIDYRANNISMALNVGAIKISTEFEDIKGDVINLVPPMRAATLTADIGARSQPISVASAWPTRCHAWSIG